jgi:hypothetical protein
VVFVGVGACIFDLWNCVFDSGFVGHRGIPVFVSDRNVMGDVLSVMSVVLICDV